MKVWIVVIRWTHQSSIISLENKQDGTPILHGAWVSFSWSPTLWCQCLVKCFCMSSWKLFCSLFFLSFHIIINSFLILNTLIVVNYLAWASYWIGYTHLMVGTYLLIPDSYYSGNRTDYKFSEQLFILLFIIL